MNPNQALKVGLIGCGSAAVSSWGHIPALKRIKQAELVAVCDRDEKLAKKTAEAFHINKYYSDLSDMLKSERMDMVDVCTPPRTHAEMSVMSMNAGRHVLVEKPMALSLTEAEDKKVSQAKNL